MYVFTYVCMSSIIYVVVIHLHIYLSRLELGTPSLLYSGYQVSSPWIKQFGHGIDHPSPSSAEVCTRVNFTFIP